MTPVDPPSRVGSAVIAVDQAMEVDKAESIPIKQVVCVLVIQLLWGIDLILQDSDHQDVQQQGRPSASLSPSVLVFHPLPACPQPAPQQVLSGQSPRERDTGSPPTSVPKESGTPMENSLSRIRILQDKIHKVISDIRDINNKAKLRKTKTHKNKANPNTYHNSGVRKISSVTNLCRTLSFKFRFIPLQFSLSKSQRTFISLPFSST